MAHVSPSTRRTQTSGDPAAPCEEAWVLVGRRRGRVWYARRIGRCTGEPASVEFDGLSVLAREERKRDVVGFLHTHPSTKAIPSRRDLKTMRAWVGAFGKPLLCLIEGTDGLAGYRFDDDESAGEPLVLVEKFPRGIVIAVDSEPTVDSVSRPTE